MVPNRATHHKFEKIHLKNDGIFSFAINQEKRFDNILKKLVASNSLSEETSGSLKPVGTRLGITYMDFVKFTKISSIVARLFDLFCPQLILLPIN